MLFAEFAGPKNALNLTDLLHLLETLTILSYGEWCAPLFACVRAIRCSVLTSGVAGTRDVEKGKISKTRAVQVSPSSPQRPHCENNCLSADTAHLVATDLQGERDQARDAV